MKEKKLATGTIQNVDPKTLTIALNVRTDTKIDKAFVASIKEVGILQPPMVTPNESGGYDVVLGQRRTLAAVEAGLSTIPVYVVDELEANAARVVDQLTENDQRRSLTEAERMGGYKQLSLFGVSPAQIAKRTSADRKTVDTALAVANDESAVVAFNEYNLTLDQAAFLVEFADDPKAVKELVKAAEKGQLDHVAADLRKKRALAALIDQLQTELVAEDVIPMQLSDSCYRGTMAGDPEGLVRVDRLGKPGNPTVELTIEDVPAHLRAGRVVKDYMHVNGVYGITAVKQYFVLNPEENGIPEHEYARPAPRDLTPEEKVKAEEREAEERAREGLKQSITAAAEVRQAWLTELLQRKSLPEVMPFIARSLRVVEARFDDIALAMSGTTTENVDSMAADPAKALRIILAATLSGLEESMRPRYYNPIGIDGLEALADYLPQLVVWGYGLSDAEQGLLDQAVALQSEQSVYDSGDFEGEEDGDLE